MDRQDYVILEELLDTVEQLQQRRLRDNPERGYRSSSRKLRKEVDDFAEECRQRTIGGRAKAQVRRIVQANRRSAT